MCGIAGLVRYGARGADLEPEALEMRRRLRTRGPDAAGSHPGPNVALAAARLALVDLPGGAQPMTSADGRYTLVYNGEVYNHAELRVELADRWTFRTRSDTEVVLAAAAAWGPACLPRLNGMFAFFLWDSKEATGFAARDGLGIKPFVYRSGSDGFAFASEAKALVGHRPRVRVEALLELVVAPYFSGVERPLFEGLDYLPAGHHLRVSRDGIRVERWWRYDPASEEVDPAALRERVTRAARRAATADVPVGAYLSGGLDSTLLVALARPAETFTVRFEGQDGYDYARSTVTSSDDTEFARLAAAELGVPSRTVVIPRETIRHALPSMALANDAVPAWEQEVAQHFLADAASARVKAVLVGDAADETHYGYHFLLGKSPAGILRLFGAERRASLLLPELREGLVDRLTRRYEELGDRLVVERWLARLLHNGDIHSMAHSLEARVPYGDTELLDLARRVPPAVGAQKALLRKAAEGLIPEAIRTRKKSALPTDQGAGELYRSEAVRLIAEREDFFRRYFDLARLRELCGGPIDEVARSGLFILVCLAHWANHYGVA